MHCFLFRKRQKNFPPKKVSKKKLRKYDVAGEGDSCKCSIFLLFSLKVYVFITVKHVGSDESRNATIAYQSPWLV